MSTTIEKPTKKLYIKTHGCQMNEYDSSRMRDLLGESHNMVATEDPEDADVILINTCSIREKAQERLFHELGRWKTLKKKNPNLVIGVGGCVASQEGEAIAKRAPHVDLIFGPQTLHRLPIGVHLWPKVRSWQRPSQNVIRCLFPGHDRRPVQVTIGHLRKDRAVSDAQAFDPDHPTFGVNHRQEVILGPHPARATGVIGAFGMVADKAVQLGIRLQVKAGLNGGFDVGFHRRLVENLTRQADHLPEIGPIARVGHIVELDFRNRHRVT